MLINPNDTWSLINILLANRGTAGNSRSHTGPTITPSGLGPLSGVTLGKSKLFRA